MIQLNQDKTQIRFAPDVSNWFLHGLAKRDMIKTASRKCKKRFIHDGERNADMYLRKFTTVQEICLFPIHKRRKGLKQNKKMFFMIQNLPCLTK